MFDVRNKITNEFILKELEPFKDRIFKTKIMKNIGIFAKKSS